MRILGFGTYDAERHPRIAIVFDGLRAHGDDVVEANHPLGFSTTERVAMVGRPRLAARLVLRLPVVWWDVARRARRARRAGRPAAVVVGYLGQLDVVLARLLFPRETVVLDLLVFGADTARDRATGSALVLRALAGLDALAVRCADVVLVDTDEHADLLPLRSRAKAVVVPVGASAAWFAAGRSRSGPWAGSPLRVVFYGLFTPLQGATVIGEALALLAGCGEVEVTMIGGGQDWSQARDAARANPAVTWLDWIEPAVLPGVVAGHDVCLGIFGTTPKARRVVPNKVYQGAAAGCAVVTSATEPQQRAFAGAAVFVPPGDAAALAEALRDLAADRGRVATVAEAGERRCAERFTAEAVVAGLRERLGP